MGEKVITSIISFLNGGIEKELARAQQQLAMVNMFVVNKQQALDQ